MQETKEMWIWSSGQEDPWRRAWQATPTFLPAESPWTEEPGRLQRLGLQRVRDDRSYLACTHITQGPLLNTLKWPIQDKNPTKSRYTYMHNWSLCCVSETNTTLCVQRLSRVRLFAIPLTIAHQAPLSMQSSRQKYWSGLPLPPLRDRPSPGIEPLSPVSPALPSRLFTTAPPGILQ